jgi:hypothetical protein
MDSTSQSRFYYTVSIIAPEIDQTNTYKTLFARLSFNGWPKLSLMLQKYVFEAQNNTHMMLS